MADGVVLTAYAYEPPNEWNAGLIRAHIKGDTGDTLCGVSELIEYNDDWIVTFDCWVCIRIVEKH